MHKSPEKLLLEKVQCEIGKQRCTWKAIKKSASTPPAAVPPVMTIVWMAVPSGEMTYPILRYYTFQSLLLTKYKSPPVDLDLKGVHLVVRFIEVEFSAAADRQFKRSGCCEIKCYTDESLVIELTGAIYRELNLSVDIPDTILDSRIQDLITAAQYIIHHLIKE